VKRSALVLALGLLAVGVGCSGVEDNSKAQAGSAKPSCPASWRPGWQRLANRIHAPVYCPAWVPSPLTAKIGGRWSTGVSVDKKDRSYLAGFIWFERGSGEVHVNLRGYPGLTKVPTCINEEQVKKRLVRTKVPCFSDSKGTHRAGAFKVTLYTVNRDADQWHLLYLWRHAGVLYTLSEHVAPPFGYQRVLQNLDRMMQNLVPIAPSA
jgi:hypothetical protein